MVIIVLGTHGGGTSLVAGMLDALGVKMGYNPRAKITVPRGTYLNYEDSELVRINNAILKRSGGNWHSIPDLARTRFRLGQEQRARKWVSDRAAHAKGRTWGAKDPRHSLTIHCWHPLLKPHDVRYVLVTRKPGAAARSIQSRGPSHKTNHYWTELSKAYLERARSFLLSVDSPRLELKFEDLMGKNAGARCAALAQFCGLPRKAGRRAQGRIRR